MEAAGIEPASAAAPAEQMKQAQARWPTNCGVVEAMCLFSTLLPSATRLSAFR